MMKASYDQHKKKVRPDCVTAFFFVRWHFYQNLDFSARILINKFCAAAYSDDPGYLIWAENYFSPEGAHPVPYYVPPVPGSKRDEQLVGRWHRTSYLFSGGASLVTYYDRVLSPDGRFVEHSRSSFSSTITDSLGNWAGWSDVYNKTPLDSRGRWATFNGRVILSWDDNHIADNAYEAGPDSFLIFFQNSENQLWKRV